MELGAKIKKLRLQRGMTLEQVGSIVGVGKSTVRKWENGDIKNMGRDKIELVANALNVSPAYLMGWEDENSAEKYSQRAASVLEDRLQDLKPGTIVTGKTKLDLTTDDDRLWQRREALRRDPKRKVLFDLAENGTDRDVDAAVKLLDALRATNPDFYDGDDPA